MEGERSCQGLSRSLTEERTSTFHLKLSYHKSMAPGSKLNSSHASASSCFKDVPLATCFTTVPLHVISTLIAGLAYEDTSNLLYSHGLNSLGWEG